MPNVKKSAPWNKGKKTGPNPLISLAMKERHARGKFEETVKVLRNAYSHSLHEAAKAYMRASGNYANCAFSCANEIERNALQTLGWLNDAPTEISRVLLLAEQDSHRMTLRALAAEGEKLRQAVAQERDRCAQVCERMAARLDQEAPEAEELQNAARRIRGTIHFP